MKLTVKGFKGLDVAVELDARVLLHGDHSSGKTSLVSALHFGLYGGVPKPDGTVVRSGAKLMKYADDGAFVHFESGDGRLEFTRSLVKKNKTLGQELVLTDEGTRYEGAAAEAVLANYVAPIMFADFSTFLSKTGEARKTALVEMLGLAENTDTRVWMVVEFLRSLSEELTPGGSTAGKRKPKRDADELEKLKVSVSGRLNDSERARLDQALGIFRQATSAADAVTTLHEKKKEADRAKKAVESTLAGLAQVDEEAENALAERIPDLEGRQNKLLELKAKLERAKKDVEGTAARQQRASADVVRLMDEIKETDLPTEKDLEKKIDEATAAVTSLATQRPQAMEHIDLVAVATVMATAQAKLAALKLWAMERIELVRQARVGKADCPTCYAPITTELAESLAGCVKDMEPERDELLAVIKSKQREMELSADAAKVYEGELETWRKRHQSAINTASDLRRELANLPQRQKNLDRAGEDLARARDLLDESPGETFDSDRYEAAKGQLERVNADLKLARDAEARMDLVRKTDSRLAEFDALLGKHAYNGARHGRHLWLQDKLTPLASGVAKDLKALGMPGDLHMDVSTKTLELGWRRESDGRVIDVETLGGAESVRFAAAILANLGKGMVTLRGEALNPNTLQRLAKWMVKQDFALVIIDTHYKPRGGFEGWQLLDMEGKASEPPDDDGDDGDGDEASLIEEGMDHVGPEIASAESKPPTLTLC